MPYLNEHTARIEDPGKYKEVRRKNNYFDSGIHALFGVNEEGKTEVQSIRFDVLEWTAEEAQRWLKDHYFEPIEFVPAELPEAVFRVVCPGTYEGKNGTFDVTEQDIEEAVEAFNEGAQYGVYPDIKFTHAKGTSSVGVGVANQMWVAQDGWLTAKGNIMYPEIRDGLKKGTLTRISLEGRKNKPVYGSRRYGLTITAISILAPGEWPAVPGAGLVEIAAGLPDEEVVVMKVNTEDVQPDVEASEGEAPEQDQPVEDPAAAEGDPEEPMEEGPSVEERIASIESRLLALEESMAGEPEEPEAAEEEPEEAPEEPVDAGQETDADIEASIAAVEKNIQAGRRESFRAYIDGLGDNSAKRIALSTAEQLGISALPEVLATGPGEADEDQSLTLEDKQEKAVNDIMASENVGIVEATVKAAKAHPELFG